MSEEPKKMEVRRMPRISIPETQANKISMATEFTDISMLIGKAWFFRTVTFYQVGIVERRVDNFLILSNASWVADTGRFADMLKTGILAEVELEGDCAMNIDHISDFFPWRHELPTKQK